MVRVVPTISQNKKRPVIFNSICIFRTPNQSYNIGVVRTILSTEYSATSGREVASVESGGERHQARRHGYFDGKEKLGESERDESSGSNPELVAIVPLCFERVDVFLGLNSYVIRPFGCRSQQRNGLQETGGEKSKHRGERRHVHKSISRNADRAILEEGGGGHSSFIRRKKNPRF